MTSGKKRFYFLIVISTAVPACTANMTFSLKLPSSTSTTSTPTASSNNSCSAAQACTSAAGPTPIPTSSTNVVPVYLADPSTTGNEGYFNEPLVSVTICTPGHTNGSQCQTISNILLDTGSFGLRVFGSAITNSNVQLTQQTITVSGQTFNLGECALFGSGADWGAVQNADVIFGGQTAANIPIQVINYNFSSIPSGCAALCPDTDPCSAGYNGILGVGMFAQDCGDSSSNPCASTNDQVNPGTYFGCNSTGCYDASHGSCGSDGVCVFTVPLTQQVVNPIASFSAGYNNGGSLTLPSISANGASAVSGTFTIGIPNTTTAGNVYLADPSGMTDGSGSDFRTVYSSTTYGYPSTTSLAFIDSGSNTIAFPSSMTECSDDPGFYCPSSTQNLSASIQGYQGTPSTSVNFSIVNVDSLSGAYSAFNDIGTQGTIDSFTVFDWGLPFFFNRTVYVGLYNTQATINSSSETGPYWAF